MKGASGHMAVTAARILTAAFSSLRDAAVGVAPEYAISSVIGAVMTPAVVVVRVVCGLDDSIDEEVMLIVIRRLAFA